MMVRALVTALVLLWGAPGTPAFACDPEQDVRGELTFDTMGRPTGGAIRNLSQGGCTYRVGVGSYKVLSDGADHIESQVLFDAREIFLEPGQEQQLRVQVPACAYQIDLFYGDLITSFRGGVRYGTRKVAATLYGMESLCPEPSCEETRIRDLRAELQFLRESDPTCALITNYSALCSYDIGIASYRMFDLTPIFTTQTLFDSFLTVVPPGSASSICVDVPPCAYQLDVFFGQPVLDPSSGESFGTRLLAAGNFVSPSRPLCAPPPNCTLRVIGPEGGLCGAPETSFAVEALSSAGDLSYQWSTSCIEGRFSAPSAPSTTLAVPSPVGGGTVQCSVGLSVVDPATALETSCTAPVSCTPPEPPLLSCTIEGGGAVQCASSEQLRELRVLVTGAVGPTIVDWVSSCPERLVLPRGSGEVVTASIPAGSEGAPCSVVATIRDPLTERSVQCPAAISFGSCVRDCAGTVDGAAVVDRCNVCDGDGSSCVPSCETVDLTGRLLALDGAANGFRSVINQAGLRLLRQSSTQSNRRFVARARAKARALYTGAWTAIWSVARVQTSCDLSPFCIRISNQESVARYSANAAALRSIADSVVRRLPRRLKESFSPRVVQLQKLVDGELAQVPGERSVCP